MHLNILGSMGVGKSTICSAIIKETGFKLIKEQFLDNPYWADSLSGKNPQFYKMQIEFMTQYITNLTYLKENPYEDIILDAQFVSGLAFSTVQAELGLIDEVDYQSYKKRFIALSRLMASDLRKVEHVLLIDSPENVHQRVISREREEEKTTTREQVELICSKFVELPNIMKMICGLEIKVIDVEGLKEGQIPIEIKNILKREIDTVK